MMKKGGAIVVNRKACDFQEMVQKIHNQSISVLNNTFEFNLMEKDKRDQFIERNNSSIMIGLKRRFNATLDRRDKIKTTVKEYDELFGPVVIGDKTF